MELDHISLLFCLSLVTRHWSLVIGHLACGRHALSFGGHFASLSFDGHFPV